MRNKYCLFIIFLLGAVTIAGCASPTRPIVAEVPYLPLNEGVNELSFLSNNEAEILGAVNKTRETSNAAGSLQPLKVSRGLSFAAKERAEELARSKDRDLTKEEERARLFEGARKFGTLNGGIAEVVSRGWPANAGMVATLMANHSQTAQQPQPYFMNREYTVMGAGCTSEGHPGPICVISVATEFNEAR